LWAFEAWLNRLGLPEPGSINLALERQERQGTFLAVAQKAARVLEHESLGLELELSQVAHTDAV